jgi:hypothetical protein
MKTKNSLLKTLKENDIVIVELNSKERANYKQICRIYNLKYLPADEKFSFDWLDFDSEILYVNWRVHPTMIDCIGNCLAITEILSKELIGIYVRQYEMWKPEEYPLSDAELETKQMLLKNLMDS